MEKYIDNHLYDHLVNNSRSMLSVISRNYRYEKVNNTFCRIQNRSSGSIIGKTLSDIWGEETFHSKIKNNIDICLKGNIVRYEADFEVPLYGKRFFEVVFSPLADDSGEITHLLAETIDITDLKVSQKTIREMEEEFKRLETSIPIGLIRCKPDGTILHYNSSFSKIIENDERENLEGLNLKDFYKEKALFDLQIFHFENEKMRTFLRVPLITCKGKEIWCRISRYIVTNKDTNLPLYIDFALEDSSREIMLENRLLQAKKLETIGSLAGGIAHDFNNILSSVFGYSEMLLDEVKNNQPAAEMTARIIKAILKAKDLTNQLLTFSRQVEQEKIPVRVKEILEEAIGLIESLRLPELKIDKIYRESDAVVYADPTQLFRVFLNLLTNAVESMKDSSGTLTVTLDIVNGEIVKKESGKSIVADDYILISIGDTGTGMEESVMSRIFEPYFTTKKIGKGSGLGLSVVYGIISELDGEITVKSEKNKGSVFSVYLPVSYEYTKDMTVSDQKRILYLSGDCHESRILSSALNKRGFIIDYKTGMEGLAKIDGKNNALPDILIFTNDPDNIDSDFFYDYIREKNINVPVILITDYDHDLSKEKLINSGIARNVLFKPVSLKELLSAIQLTLNK